VEKTWNFLRFRSYILKCCMKFKNSLVPKIPNKDRTEFQRHFAWISFAWIRFLKIEELQLPFLNSQIF
jgi:hypothetical protein